MAENEKVNAAPEAAAPAPAAKPPKKPTLPGVLALRKVVNDVYQAAWDAKKAGKPVGWSSSKFPCEICEALDLAVVYPENQAAGIGARHDGQRMCEAAEDMGYDPDICGYTRISLAYSAGVETTNETRRVPMPDFVLCCNNICNDMTKWYENIARMHNIPLIMIDVPYNNDMTVSDSQVAYIKGQFLDAIKKLEKIAGTKFSEKKFAEACHNANRTAKAWLKVCDYLQYDPSPMSGFDLFNHMADVVTARGKVAAAEAFELLDKNLAELVKKGETTTPFPEKYRIMFEGIPCWPELKTLFKPLKANGINVTAVVYAPAFGFVYDTDSLDNLDGLCRAYYKAPNSVSIEQGVAWREGLCRENKVDGALIHNNRSCKPWSGYMSEMARRFNKDLGIPCVSFDGDQADPRNFNEAQYLTRVQGLVEAMEENRQKRLAKKEEAAK
ncbi:2-hydroxyacyl-CoA dehydratase subunit D [Clostridium vitabionis]|uniref:2-hydroxyacyl-CoA dehydratase subunit D n=1 Tax=Clostridium vitabionis TaxID=2784388 RepID=UPI00188D874F|nr:2-hydroxyacyl-CoA dehydratase [Clostridium vitabionis]